MVNHYCYPERQVGSAITLAGAKKLGGSRAARKRPIGEG
jgi:hypothetical protein